MEVAPHAKNFLVRVDSLDPKTKPANSSVMLEVEASQPYSLLATPLALPMQVLITHDSAHSTSSVEIYTVSILDAAGNEIATNNMDESSSVSFIKQQIAVSFRVLS